MSKILYSKFSNERNPQFAIRTDIVKDNQNRYYVVKAAAMDEAKPHIKQILRWNKELKVLFEKTKLEPCPCEAKDEDIIFDFIKGISIEEVLDAYLTDEKYDQIFALIQDLFDICRQKSTTPFVLTEEFKNVFGEMELESKSTCFSTSNVDMIFSNIITSEEKWYLIDYEWCFEFPIPVDYILYRMLHYYVYTKDARRILIEKGIFDLLGHSCKYINQYENMEQNFQKYIVGNMVNSSFLYEQMGKGTYNIQAMLWETPTDYQGKNLEVYLDEGMGISQDTVRVVNAERQDKGAYCLTVPFSRKTKCVRIDPANCCCYVEVCKLSGVTLDDEPVELCLDIHHNGVETSEKQYVFSTQDPWFIIDVEKENLKCISLTYYLWPMGMRDEKAISALCDKQNRTFQMYAQEVDSNYHHEQEIKRLKLELEKANQKILFMEESLSWKLTKPWRQIKKKVVK